jgi:hypothetical protein
LYFVDIHVIGLLVNQSSSVECLFTFQSKIIGSEISQSQSLNLQKWIPLIYRDLDDGFSLETEPVLCQRFYSLCIYAYFGLSEEDKRLPFFLIA